MATDGRCFSQAAYMGWKSDTSASAGYPEWIQIDLGEASTIGLLRLVITQSPAGGTIHQVWVGSTLEDLYLLHTFEGHTADAQVLEFEPESPVEDVRYVRVVTNQSPSWVGWQEIEVLAP